MTTHEVSPIEKSIDISGDFPPVYIRYYTHFYFVPRIAMQKLVPIEKANFDKPPSHNSRRKKSKKFSCVENQKFCDTILESALNKEDVCIMKHSNRICIITLSPKHPAASNKTPVKVEFKIDGVDRLANKVSGKGKRGAQILNLFSPICKITCSDGSSYTIPAGVNGKLIEVNENLLKNPELISKSCQSEGYLAVVLPKMFLHEEELERTHLTTEEYEELYQDSVIVES